jgi:hypothetical protein
MQYGGDRHGQAQTDAVHHGQPEWCGTTDVPIPKRLETAQPALPDKLQGHVTNPTVYNRSIYKYNLIDVYKYNHMLL